MTNRTILESHPISTLRKEISKTNIKGYSKMKKAAVVELMLKKENASKFSHIKMREKAGAKPKEIIITPKRKIKAERAKKISAPKREAQQAKVIAPKKRVASIPKVVKAKTSAATIPYDYVVERVLAKRGKEMFEKLVAGNEEVYLESLKGRSAMEEIVKKAMIKLFKAKKFTKQKQLLDYGLKTRLNELLDDIDEEIPQTASDDGDKLFEALKEVKRLKQSNSNPQLVRAALDKVKALRKKLPAGYVELLGKRVVPSPAGGAKKPAAEKPAEPKLNYDQAKKIKQSYGTGSYFSWSNDNIPIYLWREKTDNTRDPDSDEFNKMNRSSIARYRKVFQSRHGKEMKTEEEWKKTWRDFQDEVRKEITARIKPAMR